MVRAGDGDGRPLIVHVVYRFDTGGLENGVVNLINHMPIDRYRHVVVALTEVVPAFTQRIQRDDVTFISLHKPPGHGVRLYPRLFRLLRQLRPSVVHSRNIAALECQVPAFLAGVPMRVHSEHGLDPGISALRLARLRLLRKTYDKFVHEYIALSSDLASFLTDEVKIPLGRVTRIYNGVDLCRFRPIGVGDAIPAGFPFERGRHWVIGTAGRMQGVKNQTLLARCFIALLQERPELRSRFRLVMVGEGPLRPEVAQMLAAAGVADLAWLPGERSDVAALLRRMDCFVLPSLNEGISNTVLEAMASGLPVIATHVGGNAELVIDGATGRLVPSADCGAMCDAIIEMASDQARARAQGDAGRARAESTFGLANMVAAYAAVYDRLTLLRK